jgi:hypothetical protein
MVRCNPRVILGPSSLLCVMCAGAAGARSSLRSYRLAGSRSSGLVYHGAGWLSGGSDLSRGDPRALVRGALCPANFFEISRAILAKPASHQWLSVSWSMLCVA